MGDCHDDNPLCRLVGAVPTTRRLQHLVVVIKTTTVTLYFFSPFLPDVICYLKTSLEALKGLLEFFKEGS